MALSDDPEARPESRTPLTLALVDDHELLLEGLVKALRDKPLIAEVVGYPTSEKLMEDLGKARHFDLVVTDMLMGEINGLTLAKELQSRFQTPVLLMTGVEAPPSKDELLGFGIKGFVHKSAPVEVLYEAALAVGAGGECFLYPEGWEDGRSAPKFGRQNEQPSQGAGAASLSERQVEVLKLVAAGAANKEIATTLDITENTVKTHMKHIFSALGVTKRTACVQAAKSRGLLD